jgi:hypothetical protein
MRWFAFIGTRSKASARRILVAVVTEAQLFASFTK